ncbi:hypothetical protein SAMN02745857_00610 [Andreprevotia lacus DSM 23236]|jgi:DNA-directed RNA polymerase subunit RPC12/RpoP|uniref:Uncharacterized protein n=1 Tax=Andreprevotia lacus DSM 23236 TaxID=1121001 RepID=A0A1W1X438_9NEIS|nr:hypothetical protein [Andreprevotia lacus]SMC18714.1 hypothetical protein SAMN02745857_00610 [Andreprevotia lacus DSM 23236]
MLPKQPLSRVLPIRFRNGEQVRQFSKPCVRCGHMINAKDMLGTARLLDDHIAIAAQANCPECGERFGVSCVVDMNKRVRRVVVPAWLFGMYLRNLPVQQHERTADDGSLVGNVDPEPVAAAPAPVRAPQQVVRGEEVVGRFQDKPIPAWVVVDGKRMDFERVELGQKIAAHEFLLDGCLVYKD